MFSVFHTWLSKLNSIGLLECVNCCYLEFTLFITIQIIMKTYLLLLGFILNFYVSQAQLKFEEINPAKEGHRINAIAMPTENSGVTVGDFGTILFTTDGFTTWTIVETGTKKELFAVAFFTRRWVLLLGLMECFCVQRRQVLPGKLRLPAYETA